jgi:putative membrane protein
MGEATVAPVDTNEKGGDERGDEGDPRQSVPGTDDGQPPERWHFFPGDPRSVGEDPDFRFTLANERTFLAWIRTALALAAGGLAAVTILDDFTGEEILGIGLLTLSFFTSATAYRRWALNERAMRLRQPLPASRLPLIMSVGVAIVAVLAAVLFALDVS